MDTVKLLQFLDAAFSYLEKRGLSIARAVALIENARAENRDLTDAEVNAELDDLDSALDDTANAIDN